MNSKQSNAYYAVHMWIRNNHGTPRHCESCLTTEDRMYHWANISRTYKRERSDWLRLCVPCHKRYDIKALGGHIKARPVFLQPSKICLECKSEFFKKPKFTHAQWQSQLRCGRACASKEIARKKLGVTQSDETKALKSQKLRERWATNQEWRHNRTVSMIGNQYARKLTKGE